MSRWRTEARWGLPQAVVGFVYEALPQVEVGGWRRRPVSRMAIRMMTMMRTGICRRIVVKGRDSSPATCGTKIGIVSEGPSHQQRG